MRTPSIDRIAAEGVLFRDASTPSSVCSPTRYSLLAGRYAWRTRLQSGALGVESPLLLDTDRPTVASVLQEHGYRTAMIGKWHLGYGRAPSRWTSPPGSLPGPLEIGFGLPVRGCQATMVTSPAFSSRTITCVRVAIRAELMHRERRWRQELPGPALHGSRRSPAGRRCTVMEVLTEKAIDWIEGVGGRRCPVLPVVLAGRCASADHAVARESAGTSAAGSYGDWIHDVDLAVGRILETLDRLELAEETLVLFTSDNGGVVGENRKLEASRATREGLAINGPFRGGKRSIYEGGFRVPLVARWPGAIPAGSVRGEMVGLVDLFATLAAAAGAAVPAGGAEDSVSFLPAMLGQSGVSAPRGSMVLHAGDGNFSVRWGRWKWIEGRPDPGRARRAYPSLEDEHRPQLYDLLSDPGEGQDLADRYPEVVTLMQRLLTRYRGADARQDLVESAAADTGRRESEP